MSKGKQKHAKNSKLAAEKIDQAVKYPISENVNQGHNARKESLGPNTDR